MISFFWSVVGIGAIVFSLYMEYSVYSRNHSERINSLMRGRNAAQQETVKYFCYSTGCLFNRKLITDVEYDEMVEYVVGQFDFKKMALQKLGLDEEQIKEVEPVHFEGYVYDNKVLCKKGVDTKWRSSKYQVSWLFFSSEQVYLYQYCFSMNDDEKKESTIEYFYKDVTKFTSSTETVEVSVYNNNKDTYETVKINANLFSIIVPGDEFHCSLDKSDYTERAIQGMKALLRDKKNS